MSLAVLASRAVCGFQAVAVRVEIQVERGLPAYHLVGLPDTAVRESRERVRAALLSSGFGFPDGRITVNLAPADLPKASSRFELPIALGILLASGQVPLPPDSPELALEHYVFSGELSLTGAIVPGREVLAMALSVAAEASPASFVLPPADARLAARVPGLVVLQAAHLCDVVAHFCGDAPLSPAQAAPLDTVDTEPVPCLSDVRGQPQAVRVLEIAAAGGHSTLMCGCPGVGKSMLAHRLPGLLPPLRLQEQLEVAALAGLQGASESWCERPPLRSPHHSASLPALVGGGGLPRPGEISRAHHGVLFLDELPHFDRRALEALREPMETGVVHVARAQRSVSFPARFQLIAAMNPCPCGWLGHASGQCRCSEERVSRYRSGLSGPWLDRVDLMLWLSPPPDDWMDTPAGETTESIRSRTVACRARQWRRQGVSNARLDGAALRGCRLTDEAGRLLQQAGRRWHWSPRAMDRVLRVARTIADLALDDAIDVHHMAEATQYRFTWASGRSAVGVAR